MSENPVLEPVLAAAEERSAAFINAFVCAATTFAGKKFPLPPRSRIDL